jgi:hypothetical protein
VHGEVKPRKDRIKAIEAIIRALRLRRLTEAYLKPSLPLTIIYGSRAYQRNPVEASRFMHLSVYNLFLFPYVVQPFSGTTLPTYNPFLIKLICLPTHSTASSNFAATFPGVSVDSQPSRSSNASPRVELRMMSVTVLGEKKRRTHSVC